MRGKRADDLINRLGIALVLLAITVAGIHNIFSTTSLRRRNKACRSNSPIIIRPDASLSRDHQDYLLNNGIWLPRLTE